MAPFDLQPHAPSGQCRFCKSQAPYTRSTCDNCGVRLPWADGDADRLGEKCPHCQTFNVYALQKCQNCSALLPWHECIAAIYHATHNVDREYIWMGLSIIAAGVLALLGAAWFSIPHH